jgi:hypothetical protein
MKGEEASGITEEQKGFLCLLLMLNRAALNIVAAAILMNSMKL